MSKKLKTYILSILIALAVGGISAFLSKSGMQSFNSVSKPPLSPPAWLFPIVWTILYIFMGISSAAVYIKISKSGNYIGSGLGIYIVSLAVNFFWSIIFFDFKMYLLAGLWLILLWILVLFTVIKFCRTVKWAGLLQVPYLLWTTFALYLTWAIYILD